MKNTQDSTKTTGCASDEAPTVNRKLLLGQVRTAIRAGLRARVARPLATCGDYNI